jgi:hypothetical protein
MDINQYSQPVTCTSGYNVILLKNKQTGQAGLVGFSKAIKRICLSGVWKSENQG